MPETMILIFNFISRRRVIMALGVIAVVAFLLRIVFPLQIVFGDGYISFLEGDCYSRMWYAKQLKEMPLIGGFIYAVPRGLLFPWLIAQLAYIFPIEMVGVWISPILAVGVIITVYLIGAELFNSLVGLAAAFFVAIIPSEFYHRTLLGYPDHHVMEVLLMSMAVYLVIKAIRKTTIINRYSIALAPVMFLYLANWTGGILLTFIIGLMVLILFTKKASHRTAYALGLSVAIGNFTYFAIGGFVRYFWWLPSMGDNGTGSVTTAHAGGMFSETVATYFAPISERTTSELMPLLAPFGEFDIGVVATNLHFFIITFLIGLAFLWVWRKDRANAFILLWSLMLLAITLNTRKFLYYFTLPVGLLSAWGIYELGQLSKKYAYGIMFTLMLMLMLMSMPILPLIGLTRAFTMPVEWHNTLVWLKEAPDNGMITAWSDYGHWIQYTAEKQPNYLPGPGGEDVAQLFLTTDDTVAQQLLGELDTGYLIVDNATMGYKLPAVEIVAGNGIRASEGSLAVRLLSGASVPYLTKVYESETMKVYEIKNP